MSMKFRFVLFSIFILISGALFYFSKFSNSYGFSSFNSKRPPEESLFATKGTGNQNLVVKLEYETVKSNDEAIEVIAHVSMPFDFPSELRYRWKLGDGVTIVEGENNGSIDGLVSGEEKIVKIRATGFSLQENHHIAFEIGGSFHQRYVHADALIASDPENTFENTVQNVERLKANQ